MTAEVSGYMIVRDLPDGKRMVATDSDNKMIRFDTIAEALEGLAAWVEAEWYVAHVTIIDE
jgi:hypothetical protein